MATDRVLMEFGNEHQAKAFFEWFKEFGFNEFCQSDSVNDDLPEEYFPQCIAADEEPGSISDPDAYFIQIE